jgi:GrpB-like predicted nucleotidyltransferase (UPF0157 family)
LLTPSPLIIIQPYDPNWIISFQKEAARIHTVIAPFVSSIEHIGSTAVPGLAAKPIIDILIGINSLSDSGSFIPPLLDIDYHYKPEFEVDLPERRYLYKSQNGADAFHLHMVEPRSEFYRRHIAFRDYMRSHPETAAEYASLKMRLAREYGFDREGYTNAKTAFIKDTETKAARLTP